MSREEAVKFVRELEKAANSHDARRLLEFYAEEAVMVSPVFKGFMGAVESTLRCAESLGSF